MSVTCRSQDTESNIMSAESRAQEVLTFVSADVIRERLMNMEIGQTDDQICQYLSLKWAFARSLKSCIEYLEEEIKIRMASPLNREQEVKLIKDGLAAREEELNATLSEITLIHCPVANCPTHTNQVRTWVVTNQDKKNLLVVGGQGDF
ncbi:hypothetical protein TNIN_61551 [Trichonephila inaurata madagascariensis]|uniref:Uncharacterized protein n=1 Tax=Trichonephila inaurata madagascariensis TaxID=2747483 RepID=A0A8X6Y4C5_9ARAC|nr:hypothetical protein TNIN_61551 [Trichonephila inaurata madagascariensis]